jgi:UDP-glucose 4-epimerase
LQTRCFCNVFDTVEALVRLQNSQGTRGDIFNIGGTEEITILDMAKKVLEVLKSRSAIEFVPYQQAYAPGFEDMRRRKPVVDKLFKATGFKPSTTLAGIIELAARS